MRVETDMGGTDESEEAMADSMTTKGHKTTRNWAEARGGRPAHVTATGDDGDPGLLRFDFEPKDEGLESIGSDELSQKFDQADLSFLYQDKTPDGQVNRFHMFIHDAQHKGER